MDRHYNIARQLSSRAYAYLASFDASDFVAPVDFVRMNLETDWGIVGGEADRVLVVAEMLYNRIRGARYRWDGSPIARWMDCGERRYQDGSVVSYVVIDKGEWLEAMGDESHLDSDGYYSERTKEVAYELAGMSAMYGAPGRWFWEAPSVRISRNRVLVRQFGSFDV